MSFSGWIDISIGLMLMYFLLSLVCTTLNEIWQSALKWRSKSLASALLQLISNKDLREAFYAHGRISPLVTSSGGGSEPSANPPAKAHPSYIDSLTFATALLDSIARTATGGAASRQVITTADIESVAGKIDDPKIRDVVLSGLSSAKGDIDLLRVNVAKWFDEAMDRLSGSYKRWAQLLSVLVGLGVAVALNADSIAVARALWQDQTLRGQLVEVAANTVGKDIERTTCKAAADTSQVAGQNAEPSDAAVIAKASQCQLDELNRRLAALRAFPIGWTADVWAKSDLGFWLLKFIGLLWTGFALALGATFWFDMLQKVIGIRSAGPKPASFSGAKPDAK